MYYYADDEACIIACKAMHFYIIDSMYMYLNVPKYVQDSASSVLLDSADTAGRKWNHARVLCPY